MIDYEYPDIFLGTAVQKDLLITDGTVTVADDEYIVTDDTVTLTNADLETEAFELHQSICSETELRFGSCESASINFVFHGAIPTIKGKTVKVYIIPNHDASKILQLGVFKIYEDGKVGSDLTKRKAVGYDAMYEILNADVAEWYDELLPTDKSTTTVQLMRTSFLAHFSITAEPATLINDGVSVKRHKTSEMMSGGDVIKAICEINGVFGRITNEGKFGFFSLDPDFDNASEINTTELIDCQWESYYAEPITTLKIILDRGETIERGQASEFYKNTYVVSGNMIANSMTGTYVQRLTAVNALLGKIVGHSYVPATVKALGNPVHEAGDAIRVWARGDREIITYILERRLSGIQALRDSYNANGTEFYNARLNSTAGRYEQLNNEISQATQMATVTANNDFVETIRNIGFRLLDEPSDVSVEYDDVNNEVSLKWTDPDDIDTNEPVPCEWAGTVVVRKENSAPLHRWDGTLIVDSTTRDEYRVSALVDNTVEANKSYFYGIFPYDTKGDYRFTCCRTINHSAVVHSIQIEVSEEDGFRYNGVNPSIIGGSMGVYDSESESYYFENPCQWTYSGTELTPNDIRSWTQIEVSFEAKVQSTTTGNGSDMNVGFADSLSLLSVNNVLIAVGANGSEDFPQPEDTALLILNNGSNKWLGKTPFDMEVYYNAFHEVKYIVNISNGVVGTVNCYVDGTLYNSTNMGVSFNYTMNKYYILFGMIDHAYLKSIKIKGE